MKIKGRRCDICGHEMDGRCFQYWIRRPRILRGYPDINMENLDVCESCILKLLRLIREQQEEKE